MSCCERFASERIQKVPLEREPSLSAFKATELPPSDQADLREQLHYLVQVVREECFAAAIRHEDVLTRLSEHEQAFSNIVPQARDKLHSPLVIPSPPPDNNRSPLEPVQRVPSKKGAIVAFTDTQVEADATPAPTGLSRKSQLNLGRGLRRVSVHGGSGWLVNLVTHEKFEAIVAAVILSSAVVMCFEVQYQGLQVGFDLQYPKFTEESQNVWPAASQVFLVCDWFFGAVFFSEAALKLGCFGLRYFVDLWNWLDLVVVLAFLIDKLASTYLPINKQMLQLLRLFRLVRLFRLLETLEGLDALYIMTTAIKEVQKVLLWGVILLLVMLTTVALFLAQILHAYYFNEISTNSNSLVQQQKLYEYFGSFTRCLLSMFELTLANWPPVTRLLSEEVTEWFMVVCVVHKLIIGFAVIGVINGVIMQETFKVAATDDMLMVRQKRKSSDLLKKKMAGLFQALDNSDDGTLGYEEFQTISLVPEVATWLASMDIETDDLPSLFELIDEDGSGTIPVEELVKRIPRIKGPARSIDMLAMAKRLKEGKFSMKAATLSQCL